MRAPTFETHEVFNQPQALGPRNLFETDPVLIGAVETILDRASEKELGDLGQFHGSPEARELARLIDAHPPVLRAYDAYGRRLGAIDHHPAWLALMQRAAIGGLGISLWDERSRSEAGRRHVLRTVRLFLAAQTDAAHLVPWSHSSAAVSVLLGDVDLADEWLPSLVSRRFDHRFAPRDRKNGALLGLGLTEKQGPMENGATVTDATRSEGRRYALVGHKWWLSAPLSDGFIMLADAPGGPSAFLVPQFSADGRPNRIVLPALKQTVGMRGLPIGEVELRGAEGWLIGEEGRGPDMLDDARRLLWLDSAAIGAGMARAAVIQAIHHARGRKSGADKLYDIDLMTRVLADMTLDVAAATTLCVRLAAAHDLGDRDAGEAAFFRIIAPAAKYWISKTVSAITAEAMECLGGTGWTEASEMARAWRDAQATALWPTTGNVLANEVLSVVASDPDALDAALRELGRDRSATADLIRGAARACLTDRGSARVLIEQLALAAAASSLERYAPRALAEAFVDTRLSGTWRASYGMLDGRFDARGIVDYGFPGF